MKIKNINSNVTFEVFEIDKNNYLNIKVEAEQKLESVSLMEFIHDKINENNSEFERYYTIINTYDSISEFYCNEIFCKFNHFERVFRKLLFNIYITNYSEDYFNKIPIDEETMNKIKRNIKTPSKNKTIRNRIYNKKFFYALDYGDLQSILFKKNWTHIEEDIKNQFLNAHKNLSSVSDNDLRAFINNLRPKTDWERLFEDKVKIDNIEQKINYIREKRNQVAHNKSFTKDEYEESINILDILIKAVNNAIIFMQDNYFLEENLDSINLVRESFQKITKPQMKLIKVYDMIRKFPYNKSIGVLASIGEFQYDKFTDSIEKTKASIGEFQYDKSINALEREKTRIEKFGSANKIT